MSAARSPIFISVWPDENRVRRPRQVHCVYTFNTCPAYLKRYGAVSKVSSRQYTSGWKSVALREIPVHGTYVTILITGLLSRDNLCRPLIPHNRINTHAMGTGSPCRLLFGGRPDNGWTGRERERERERSKKRNNTVQRALLQRRCGLHKNRTTTWSKWRRRRRGSPGSSFASTPSVFDGVWCGF